MLPRLETARLILAPLVKEDAPLIQQAFPRWDIVKYLTRKVPWPYPANGAEFFCEKTLHAIQQQTEWVWTLLPLTSPTEFIGLIRLSLEVDNNRGFWLVPEWQGQGYMREACHAATDFWFNQLKQPVLRAPKAKENQRSLKISQQSGMRMIREEIGEYHIGDIPSTLWKITREEWNGRYHPQEVSERGG